MEPSSNIGQNIQNILTAFRALNEGTTWQLKEQNQRLIPSVTYIEKVQHLFSSRVAPNPTELGQKIKALHPNIELTTGNIGSEFSLMEVALACQALGLPVVELKEKAAAGVNPHDVNQLVRDLRLRKESPFSERKLTPEQALLINRCLAIKLANDTTADENTFPILKSDISDKTWEQIIWIADAYSKKQMGLMPTTQEGALARLQLLETSPHFNNSSVGDSRATYANDLLNLPLMLGHTRSTQLSHILYKLGQATIVDDLKIEMFQRSIGEDPRNMEAWKALHDLIRKKMEQGLPSRPTVEEQRAFDKLQKEYGDILDHMIARAPTPELRRERVALNRAAPEILYQDIRLLSTNEETQTDPLLHLRMGQAIVQMNQKRNSLLVFLSRWLGRPQNDPQSHFENAERLALNPPQLEILEEVAKALHPQAENPLQMRMEHHVLDSIPYFLYATLRNPINLEPQEAKRLADLAFSHPELHSHIAPFYERISPAARDFDVYLRLAYLNPQKYLEAALSTIPMEITLSLQGVHLLSQAYEKADPILQKYLADFFGHPSKKALSLAHILFPHPQLRPLAHALYQSLPPHLQTLDVLIRLSVTDSKVLETVVSLLKRDNPLLSSQQNFFLGQAYQNVGHDANALVQYELSLLPEAKLASFELSFKTHHDEAQTLAYIEGALFHLSAHITTQQLVSMASPNPSLQRLIRIADEHLNLTHILTAAQKTLREQGSRQTTEFLIQFEDLENLLKSVQDDSLDALKMSAAILAALTAKRQIQLKDGTLISELRNALIQKESTFKHLKWRDEIQAVIGQGKLVNAFKMTLSHLNDLSDFKRTIGDGDLKYQTLRELVDKAIYAVDIYSPSPLKNEIPSLPFLRDLAETVEKSQVFAAFQKLQNISIADLETYLDSLKDKSDTLSLKIRFLLLITLQHKGQKHDDKIIETTVELNTRFEKQTNTLSKDYMTAAFDPLLTFLDNDINEFPRVIDYILEGMRNETVRPFDEVTLVINRFLSTKLARHHQLQPYEAYNAYATFLLEQGNYQKAYDYFTQAMEIDPSRTEAIEGYMESLFTWTNTVSSDEREALIGQSAPFLQKLPPDRQAYWKNRIDLMLA